MTDAARFEPLQAFARGLLRRLESEFDVARVDAIGLDPELEQAQLGGPTVRLAPLQASSAPLVVAFTAFPGLMVRCGRWLVQGFPACGCDACDETAEGEVERLVGLIDDVTHGRFRESIRIPLLGAARYEYELGRPGSGRGWSRLERKRAHELVGGGARSFAWQPWLSR